MEKTFCISHESVQSKYRGIPGRRNRKQRHKVSQISLFQVLHVQRDDLLGTKYHLKSFFFPFHNREKK